MISEGPSLVEALPGELQNALNGALRPGEQAIIAVRGNPREAFAATRERILILKEPVITGVAPVECRELPLSSLSSVRAEPRPVGGRLCWETTEAGVLTSFDYPTYDAAKFELVAAKLREMIGEPRMPAARSMPPVPGAASAPAPASAGRACPKCQTPVPEDGCWCPNCGLQTADPCWECGRPLREGDNFCAFCGTPNTEPAVVYCPQCKAVVGRGQVYCTGCGAQARLACEECDQPMRREWKYCPACGGEPVWEEEDIESGVAPRREEEPEDPSAWLPTAPHSRDAEELNAAGVRAYEAGDYHEAVRLFREATEAGPSNSSYFTNLGVACGELGDDLQAFAAYRRAVELNPEEISAYLNMGYLYMERERLAEAREMWETVIRKAPDSDEAQEARQNLKNSEEV